MSKTTILVVEDEAIVAADLAGKLTRLGYEVVGTTARGEDAVELTCRLHPQLVLMDVSLEGSFDGIAAAEAIRCQHDVPVIYLTAHSDPTTLARAKLTGPFGYILKPFEERELVTQIELALYKHQADTQIREQREWLRVTLTSIGDAVIATDAAGRITFINPVAESLTGWSAEAASGQPVPDVFRIVNDQTGEPLEEPVARVLREGRTIELANHAAVVTKDGREVPIEDSAAPILDAAGRVIGVVLVFHDVTARRRAEETLREAEEALRQHVRALEEADGQKDEFLAMLAHELRNPLAPISAAVQLLDRPEVDRKLVTKTCAVIGRQVRHMTRLVDDLLDVSRIRCGKIELQQEHVDLAEIFNGAIELNRDYIEFRQHRLTVSQPASKVVVCGDRVRLTQIVSNLLHNAAKYMSDGGQIGLMIERMEEHVVIRVKDSGVGIPPAMLTRVFDLFVQADESLDRSQGGLGLGLTLVRQLVDLHGGTVEALSGGLHQGSEFVVRLPLVPQTAVQRVSLPERSADLASPAAYRILVVDDNDDAASMLAGLIELLGHHVKFVHDGSSALAVIESFRPDVVLLDIGLPEPNGYQVAEQIRLAYTSEEILLIALTGYGHDQAVQRSRQAGFDHHLVKPLKLDTLRQLLTQYRPPPQIEDSEKC